MDDESSKPTQQEMDPTREKETSYSIISQALIALDKTIPEQGLEIWRENRGLAGKARRKEKIFRAQETLPYIRSDMESLFPHEHEHILDAAAGFLQRLSARLKPELPFTVPYGQVDQFLVGFPSEMARILGPSQDQEWAARIFRIGSTLIDKEEQRLSARRPSAYTDQARNTALGTAALYVGEVIPSIVRMAEDRKSEALAEIEEFATSLPFADFRKYIEHYQKQTELNPEELDRLALFEDKIRALDPNYDAISNPFTAVDRQQWRDDALMSRERHTPTWGDLGTMVAAAQKDRREYGIAMNKEGQGTITTEYIRGADTHIYNKTGIRPHGVFFHAHPSISTEREALAHLISVGDIMASLESDHGGGYLNVAYTDGITLHIGRSQMGMSIPEEADILYSVESGELRGSTIAHFGEKIHDAEQKDIEIMTKLRETKKPYIYSISSLADGQKYYFVHLPWNQIGISTSLEKVCYEDGLPKVLQGVEELPIQIPTNLYDALTNRDLNTQD